MKTISPRYKYPTWGRKYTTKEERKDCLKSHYPKKPEDADGRDNNDANRDDYGYGGGDHYGGGDDYGQDTNFFSFMYTKFFFYRYY